MAEETGHFIYPLITLERLKAMRRTYSWTILLVLSVLFLTVSMPSAMAYSAYGWQWPVDSSSRLITQGFHSSHGGIDINGSSGKTKIYPTKPGVVIKVYTGCTSRSVASVNNTHSCSKTTCNPNTGNYKKYTKTYKKTGEKLTYHACNYGFGNGVVIDHRDGTYSSYAHMHDVNVKEGETVYSDTCLGTVGWTGNAAGAHLHFAVGTSYEKAGKYVHVTGTINPNPASEACKIKTSSKGHKGLTVTKNGFAIDNGKNSGGTGLNYTLSTHPIPGTPTLKVTGGTSLTSTVFEWNYPTDTDYFTLRIYNSDGTLYKTYGGLIKSSNSYVLPAGSYNATVTAVDSTHNDWTSSKAVSFTVRAASVTSSPGKPTLKVSPSSGETTFSWEQTSNTEYYTLRIFDSSGDIYRLRGGWRNTYFNALLPAGNYSATLASVNNTAGTYTFSNKVSFTVPSPSTPEPGEYVAGNEVNHKLFNVYKKPNGINWGDAKVIAKASTGRFATIKDSDEQDVVASLVAGYGQACWIGAEAFSAEGTWKWADGSNLSFTNWAENQPEMGYGLQNCLQIMPSGEWNDETNFWFSNGGRYQNVYGYVLEFDPIWISAFSNVDTKAEGSPALKGDVLVYVCFADQSLVPTNDYEVSVSGTTVGKQTITVRYGNLTDTVDVDYVRTREMSKADFILPKSTTIVEQDAFRGNSMRVARCPEGVTEIGSGAFADCYNLQEVYIPASVQEIDDDIFTGCPETLTIFAPKGSAAEEFAEVYNYKFMPVSH